MTLAPARTHTHGWMSNEADWQRKGRENTKRANDR